MNRSIGVILLVVYLCIVGLKLVTNFDFEQERLITGCVAIAAAIFLAVGK